MRNIRFNISEDLYSLVWHDISECYEYADSIMGSGVFKDLLRLSEFNYINLYMVMLFSGNLDY